MILGRIWLFAFMLGLTAPLCAAPKPAAEPVPVAEEAAEVKPPAEPTRGNWLFTGMVKTDSGDLYAYFFNIQRADQQLRAQAALFNAQSKQLIDYYDQTASWKESDDAQWKVGRAFMQHNLITDTWIIGLKARENKGFNFKVDMLKQAETLREPQTLRRGLKFMVRQTSRLNGHIQPGGEEKEFFVTSDNSWFAKAWVTEKQDRVHDIQGLFCRMNDNSGFYWVNMKEPDARKGSFAGWRDAEANEVKMSQFLTLTDDHKGGYTVKISLPKLQIQFNNLLADQADAQAVAGFFKEDQQGFCLLDEMFFDLPDVPEKSAVQ